MSDAPLKTYTVELTEQEVICINKALDEYGYQLFLSTEKRRKGSMLEDRAIFNYRNLDELSITDLNEEKFFSNQLNRQKFTLIPDENETK